MKAVRIFIVITMMFCLAFSTQATPVNPEQTRKAAICFFYERMNQVKTVPVSEIVISKAFEIRKDGQLLYYAYNFLNGGWILVSGDDRVIPVLGYSFEGAYGDKNEVSCCYAYWMNKVENEISSAINNDALTFQTAKNQWNELLSRDYNNLPVFSGKAITPLLQSTWGQGADYNALCPAAIGGPDDHALVGCVATAMSQVMYYYRYPAQGLGSRGGVNFSNFYYRWNEMRNSISEANQGVAEICSHAGVAVDMDYGADGSGAYTQNVPSAMEDYFRYSSDAIYRAKWGISNSTWLSYLTTNLDARHPVIYSGSSSEGGHAWVCDGYQGTDYFHMNWGWDGAYQNVYFYLDNLTVSTSDFNSSQAAVFDLYPPTSAYPAGCSGTITVPYSQGSIADGSGPSNYANNKDCRWLIDPTENVSRIKIDCLALSTEATNDVVTIYDGDNTSANVLGTWSGSALPSTVITTGDKALVVFTTNGAVNNSGWYLEYTSIFPIYCSGNPVLTDPSGSIEDGSTTFNYSSNQTCRWSIQPANAASITIDFTAFDLATDDWVKIFDNNTGVLLATYTGTTLPAELVCNTSKVLVFFKSDAANNAGGWALNYSSVQAGLVENPSFGNFLMYPNPAQNKVVLEFTPVADQNCNVDILTMDGRIVLHKEYRNISGSLHTEFDISGLSNGLYMFRISGENGNLVTKLVVE